MLHIYPMCEIVYLPNTDTGTRDCQFLKMPLQKTSSWNFAEKGTWWLISGPPAKQVDVLYK